MKKFLVFIFLLLTLPILPHSFDVLGSKLYVVTRSDHQLYIQEYIDSVNAGMPNKEVVIRRYATESKMSESFIDPLIALRKMTES
jgi:hypothetical protein